MSAFTAMSAPLVSEPGPYLHAGVLSISVANALVILAMIVIFVLAILLPFPSHYMDESADGDRS